MRISLIVCTRNRAAHLPPVLEAFSRLQTTEPWQLIIVNNGSTDETQELLEAFAKRDPSHVRLVKEATPGVGRAQNAALEHASGEIIAFTDDDCYPEPDYLERIRECFLERPIDYLGGRVLLYDPCDAAVTIQASETRLDLPAHCYISPGFIHGAALAFTRKAIDAIGGFDPACGPGSELGSGSDIIALIRCSAMGFRGAYDPRPVVYHHHRRKSGADLDRLKRRYDVSRGAAYLLGLSSPGTRRAYMRPAVRQLITNVRDRNWGSLARELRGAYRYAWILTSRSRLARRLRHWRQTTRKDLA